MKIVVTGGRDYRNNPKLRSILKKLNPNTLLVGDCPTGADHYAREWALDSIDVTCTIFRADWDSYGKSAGPRRNVEMLEAAGNAIVLAFKGGRGTAHCVSEALKRGIPVLEVRE